MALARTASEPYLQSQGGRSSPSQLQSRRVCAGGTGGLHFLQQHPPERDLHEAALDRMWAQRRRQQEHDRKSSTLLHHDSTPHMLEGIAARFSSYSVNGKEFGDGLQPCPRAPRGPSSHWLCQVSGEVNGFNIVNGTSPSPAAIAQRKDELQRFWGRQAAISKDGRLPAGRVVPQLPVDHRSFHIGKTMTQPKEYMGVRERRELLTS
mmetsp:Transcript_36748/g.78027  ORF Transcript_36748/g.78027 Transcript_36748/m.78027 type:complete len:207 (-) Transcript_36748:26-646(-)|eukprot:CAMPEP_0206435714 /NCGR_PEP_ID=MMETSP0324_2-20121206/10042_1 /ASSEMBLY_ACC=CAM_ASM_000836 /TAXON_ID=2866 /ORGANISM="Crypthecodinium cohnii, Strain Seligo" /LENGTH=206 /DNA_ID=CAMNT_0053902721 /DNA_START=64 /DNA_END=684 /DNA_ORIENTATION=+